MAERDHDADPKNKKQKVVDGDDTVEGLIKGIDFSRSDDDVPFGIDSTNLHDASIPMFAGEQTRGGQSSGGGHIIFDQPNSEEFDQWIGHNSKTGTPIFGGMPISDEEEDPALGIGRSDDQQDSAMVVGDATGDMSAGINHFAWKLYDVLEDEKNHKIIKWNEDGTVVKIADRERCGTVLVPMLGIGKNATYRTFYEALHSRGFKFSSGGFKNDNFKYGHKELLSKITKDKKGKAPAKAEAAEPPAEPPLTEAAAAQHFQVVHQELNAVKTDLNDSIGVLQEKFEGMENNMHMQYDGMKASIGGLQQKIEGMEDKMQSQFDGIQAMLGQLVSRQ